VSKTGFIRNVIDLSGSAQDAGLAGLRAVPSAEKASRLKVAILSTDARDLLRNYHEVVPRFGTAPQALFEGLALFPEVEVHVVSCTQQPMQSPAKLAENIFFHSLRVRKIGWMRTGFQGCIRATRKALRQIRPDIVHGQGTERDCAMNAVYSGFPNVLTIHGNIAELARFLKSPIGSYWWFAARLENVALRRTLGVFCNSEYTEGLVGPRAQRTWRVPNAVRLPFFQAPRKTPAQGKCRLLSIGQISPRKRQVELLEMARQLHQQGLDFELEFLGLATESDPYTATFFERIKEAEAKGFARYSGLKLGEELIACFDAAHALVHFPNEEAFGLAVAEALARDLKLFAARLGGIVDICNDVPGVELFEPEDWQGLRKALANWMRGGHGRSGGSAGTMNARYHPSVIAHRHLEIYREVLPSSLARQNGLPLSSRQRNVAT